MHQSLLEFGAKENVDIMILGKALVAKHHANIRETCSAAHLSSLYLAQLSTCTANLGDCLKTASLVQSLRWSRCTALRSWAVHAGSKEHKGTVQRMVQPGGIGHASTSDTIKSKSKRPCLVVRPAVSLTLASIPASHRNHMPVEDQQFFPTQAGVAPIF